MKPISFDCPLPSIMSEFLEELALLRTRIQVFKSVVVVVLVVLVGVDAVVVDGIFPEAEQELEQFFALKKSSF